MPNHKGVGVIIGGSDNSDLSYTDPTDPVEYETVEEERPDQQGLSEADRTKLIQYLSTWDPTCAT